MFVDEIILNYILIIYIYILLYILIIYINYNNIIFNILDSTISLKSCVHNARNRFQFSDGERIDQSHSVN